MGRAHLGQMPLVETPYSTICVDLVEPLSPPSEEVEHEIESSVETSRKQLSRR